VTGHRLAGGHRFNPDLWLWQVRVDSNVSGAASGCPGAALFVPTAAGSAPVSCAAQVATWAHDRATPGHRDGSGGVV